VTILLIIGYYLFVDVIYMTFAQTKIGIKLEKYNLGILALSFLLFAIASTFEKVYDVALIAGLFVIFFLYYFIKRLLRDKGEVTVIDIPENAYEIETTEEVVGTVLIRYILKYQNKSYLLSSIPGKSRPQITLIVHEKEGKIPVARMIVRKKEKTFQSRMETFRKICLLIAAILLPVPLLIKSEGLFGGLITIMFGAIGWSAFENGETVLLKMLYYFCIIIFFFGLLAIPMVFVK